MTGFVINNHILATPSSCKGKRAASSGVLSFPQTSRVVRIEQWAGNPAGDNGSASKKETGREVLLWCRQGAGTLNVQTLLWNVEKSDKKG